MNNADAIKVFKEKALLMKSAQQEMIEETLAMETWILKSLDDAEVVNSHLKEMVEKKGIEKAEFVPSPQTSEVKPTPKITQPETPIVLEAARPSDELRDDDQNQLKRDLLFVQKAFEEQCRFAEEIKGRMQENITKLQLLEEKQKENMELIRRL